MASHLRGKLFRIAGHYFLHGDHRVGFVEGAITHFFLLFFFQGGYKVLMVC